MHTWVDVFGLDCGKTSKKSKWTDDAGNIKWPPNDGFANKPKNIKLKIGSRIDRYGHPRGYFVSPEGVPFSKRSLPPYSKKLEYNIYEVIKPLDALAGKAAPWFDEVGGGTQYKLNKSIQELLDSGYIKKIKL